MKRCLTAFIIFVFFNTTQAQYNPGAFHYGIVGVKGLESIDEVGLGARVEFAYNCYNTFLVEYNRLFSVGDADGNNGYNEIGINTNLILFNWYPTTITAGMGYIGNDDSNFERREDDATLSFRTGDINHGVQIKLRALHHLTKAVHLFGEFNVKSLGRNYHTFLVGFSYDFNPRR